jgi:hypothetical protein
VIHRISAVRGHGRSRRSNARLLVANSFGLISRETLDQNRDEARMQTMQSTTWLENDAVVYDKTRKPGSQQGETRVNAVKLN